MTIKPSTALRNEYPKISLLARETGEPIFITNKGGSRRRLYEHGGL